MKKKIHSWSQQCLIQKCRPVLGAAKRQPHDRRWQKPRGCAHLQLPQPPGLQRFAIFFYSFSHRGHWNFLLTQDGKQLQCFSTSRRGLRVTFEIRVCSLAFDIFFYIFLFYSAFHLVLWQMSLISLQSMKAWHLEIEAFASLLGLLAKDWKQESSLLWNQWGIPKKAAAPCWICGMEAVMKVCAPKFVQLGIMHIWVLQMQLILCNLSGGVARTTAALEAGLMEGQKK